MKSSKNVAGTIVRKKNRLFPRLIIAFFVIIIFIVSAFIFFRVVIKEFQNTPRVSQLYTIWEDNDYDALYEQSGKILQKNINQNTALTFRGFSAFFLAISQTDTTLAQQYIDESINCLRIALQDAPAKSVPQIEYMLGKAYFQKNNLSSYYYYADLAVKYLLEAKEKGFSADDIPEYLGLSYASLNMIDESIASFTDALLIRESDVLLLSIAEQYYKKGILQSAKPYLVHLIEISTDDINLLNAHSLLGQIYIDEEKYDEAVKEFETILQKNANFADAYYGLGVIYEKQGDLVKARAEWRKALKVQVNHPGALKKMGL